LVTSLVISLVFAELAASTLRHHAFPYLNIFKSDVGYGVVLKPFADTRTRSRHGRITEVRTNELGFRGQSWFSPKSSPERQRIMLLGDSQMFAYGVDESDGISEQLATRLGTKYDVLNAAVPTWGPAEYLRALEDYASKYRPEVVLFVVNLANDWYEVNVPNARRTSARDGWAVRKTRRPAPATWFPGRSFFLGESHLVFGVREILNHIDRQQSPSAHTAIRLLRDVPKLSNPSGVHRSKMTPRLLEAKSLCKRYSCRLIAVTLPIDVQVHTDEWKKYESKPRDVRALDPLLDAFVQDMQTHEIQALNLLPILTENSPGTFLPDDYHLSIKGHRVVAEAFANIVRSPKIKLATTKINKEVTP